MEKKLWIGEEGYLREARLYDICNFWINKYPEDVFESEPKEVVEIRELMKKILEIRELMKKILEKRKVCKK